MDNRRTSDCTNEKFTWIIENFSKLSPKKLFSQTFIVGGYSWRILMFPNGNNVNNLSLYLDAADAASLPRGWSRYAAFSLAVINQVNSKWTVKKETLHQFNGRENDWGFTAFMPLSEFRNPRNGYLVKDTCIIDAEVSIPKSGIDNQVDQAAGITASQKSGGQAGQMEVEPPQQECKGQYPPLSALVSSEPTKHTANPSLPTATPIGELMDFRSLGQIEKAFVHY